MDESLGYNVQFLAANALRREGQQQLLLCVADVGQCTLGSRRGRRLRDYGR